MCEVLHSEALCNAQVFMHVHACTIVCMCVHAAGCQAIRGGGESGGPDQCGGGCSCGVQQHTQEPHEPGHLPLCAGTLVQNLPHHQATEWQRVTGWGWG